MSDKFKTGQWVKTPSGEAIIVKWNPGIQEWQVELAREIPGQSRIQFYPERKLEAM